MGLFDNATSVLFNNKEVSSMKVGDDVIYEKISNNNENVQLPFDSKFIEEDDCVIGTTSVSSFTLPASLITYTGTVTVDWGDGSQTETYSNSSITHNYEDTGKYDITLTGNITGWSMSLQTKTDIEYVILPKGITQIPARPFDFCSNFQTVVIPDSVTSMSGGLANGIHNAIIFKGATPPAASTYTFYHDGDNNDTLSTNVVIYVPSGSLSAYTSAENYPNPANYSYVEY